MPLLILRCFMRYLCPVKICLPMSTTSQDVSAVVVRLTFWMIMAVAKFSDDSCRTIYFYVWRIFELDLRVADVAGRFLFEGKTNCLGSQSAVMT